MTTATSPITTIDSACVEQDRAHHIPLVDVRPASMYDAGHIPGAKNIPLVVPADGSMISDADMVSAVEAAGIKPDDDVVLYCQTGYHANLAAQTLAKEGFSHIELYSGSMNDWTAKRLPVEA